MTPTFAPTPTPIPFWQQMWSDFRPVLLPDGVRWGQREHATGGGKG